MRLNQWVLVIITLIFCAILIIYINLAFATQTQELDEEYADKMLAATTSALGAAENISDDTAITNNIFADREAREAVIEAFYKSFGDALGYDFSKSDGTDDYESGYNVYLTALKYHVPCIVLVDNDGMYIYHVEEATDEDFFVCSSLNKWTDDFTYGNRSDGIIYTVDYHLDDTINVKRLDMENKETSVYTGNYQVVLEQLKAKGDVPGELTGMLSDDEKFWETKTNFITSQIENSVNYYTNEMNNRYTGQYATKTGLENPDAYIYDISFPYSEGQDFARYIDEPTVLSFFQGEQFSSTFTSRINIYAFAGSEVSNEILYYIKDGLYHKETCSMLSDEDKKHGYTMRNAAIKGAYPCSECMYNIAD